MVGLGLLAGLAPAAPVLEPLAFGAACTLVLVVVAVWETRSLGSPRKERAVELSKPGPA